MMNKKLLLIIILIGFLLLSRCSYVKVYDINTTSPKDLAGKRGMFYALPKTVITIDVTVNKVEYIPGPYANFAEKYLNLSNVSRRSSNSYELSNVEIGSYVIADNNSYYFVHIPKRLKSKFEIKLSELGLLTSVNSEASLLDKTVIPIEKKVDYSINQKESGRSKKSFITAGIKEKIDTIIERISIDTTIIEKRKYLTSLVKKSDEEKAKEASEFIFKLRKIKLDLISGESETAYSENTLKLMVNELDKLEQEYISLFTGTYNTTPMKYHFTFIPDEKNSQNETVLFKFSEIYGVCSPDYAFGDEITISIERNNSLSKLHNFVNQLDKNYNNKKGFYYKIPELAKVIVKSNGNVKSENNIIISQFGITTFLPFSKLKQSVELYPNTGSIKTMSFSK